ncbi:CorA family divalent cation transporter [Photobacterium sp. J15]|uniref:CorA family divalent cation transporter n=1 Tax=Photobacterium sp. J15 TaxID=265901 RepID=UPI0007E3FF76|nr:CorA family divalent cation transporter [Photobacterium sp. J15]
MYIVNIKDEIYTPYVNLKDIDLDDLKGVLWIHFQGDFNETKDEIQSLINVDDFTLQALCNEQTRPRAFVNDHDELVVTLRAVNYFSENDARLVSLRLWMGDKILISISEFEIPALEFFYKKLCKRSNTFKTAYHLLWQLIDCVNDGVNNYTSDIEESLTLLEDKWDNNQKIVQSELSEIRYAISNSRRFLFPQLEGLQKTSKVLEVEFISEDDYSINQMRWREIINIAKRDLEVLSEMTERVNILRDSYLQLTNESLTKTMFLLSVVATFFLPLTFIASLLGMNVNGIPGSSSSWAFGVVCAVMGIFAVIQWNLFKRWKWLH